MKKSFTAGVRQTMPGNRQKLLGPSCRQQNIDRTPDGKLKRKLTKRSVATRHRRAGVHAYHELRDLAGAH